MQSTFGVATMSMASVLTLGAAIVSDLPLWALGFPGPGGPPPPTAAPAPDSSNLDHERSLSDGGSSRPRRTPTQTKACAMTTPGSLCRLP